MSTTTKNRKKRSTAILAAILVLVIAIGATLAYLAAVTEEYENAFSFAQNIRGGLSEPNWDPETSGKDIVPGMEMRKDPMITNLSDNGIDEFVAIRVNFTDGKGKPLSDDDNEDDYVGRLLALLDIDWNTTDWDLADNAMKDCAEQVWVYNKPVAPGETTNPLFSTVTVKSEIDGMTQEEWDTEYAWLASIIMDHTDACYKINEAACAGADECDFTYKHHKKCPVYGHAKEGETAKEGTIAGVIGDGSDDLVCDCTPAKDHEDDCKALENTLLTGADACEHEADGISGFKIFVRGAVVQADVEGMTDWNSTDTIDALLGLFTKNAYTQAPVTP